MVKIKEQLDGSDRTGGLIESGNSKEIRGGVELGSQASCFSAGDSIGDVIATPMGGNGPSHVAAFGGRHERREVPQFWDRRTFQMAERPPRRMPASGTQG